MLHTNRKHKQHYSISLLLHRHSAELRRVKSLNETSSKLKQERWMDEKTRRIREQAISTFISTYLSMVVLIMVSG